MPVNKPDGRKIYLGINVLEATQKRIAWAFDTYEHIVVSISGGKDSQVVFELAHAEAVRRRRAIFVFFLDQEAEYASSIEVVKATMERPLVVPLWYQVPIRMTNSTSVDDEWFRAWFPGETWVRPQDPLAITTEPRAPDRFYAFMDWIEGDFGAGAAFLVGLRSEESLNRFGAVTRNPATPGVPWSSKGANGAVRVYPIYDWSFEDVWTYLGKNHIAYNRVYDYLWVRGVSINEFRVSFLLHEKSFKCMAALQEFEHDTYERVITRVRGAHTSALYAKEQTVYAAKQLPKRFASWKAYRDFLLSEHPEHRQEAFLKRFAKQDDIPQIHRQQVKQLLINDWENNVPINTAVAQVDDTRKKWMDLL